MNIRQLELQPLTIFLFLLFRSHPACFFMYFVTMKHQVVIMNSRTRQIQSRGNSSSLLRSMLLFCLQLIFHSYLFDNKEVKCVENVPFGSLHHCFHAGKTQLHKIKRIFLVNNNTKFRTKLAG